MLGPRAGNGRCVMMLRISEKGMGEKKDVIMVDVGEDEKLWDFDL